MFIYAVAAPEFPLYMRVSRSVYENAPGVILLLCTYYVPETRYFENRFFGLLRKKCISVQSLKSEYHAIPPDVL